MKLQRIRSNAYGFARLVFLAISRLQTIKAPEIYSRLRTDCLMVSYRKKTPRKLCLYVYVHDSKIRRREDDLGLSCYSYIPEVNMKPFVWRIIGLYLRTMVPSTLAKCYLHGQRRKTKNQGGRMAKSKSKSRSKFLEKLVQETFTSSRCCYCYGGVLGCTYSFTTRFLGERSDYLLIFFFFYILH